MNKIPQQIILILSCLLTLHLSAQTPVISVNPDDIGDNLPLFGYNHIYANRGGKLINTDSSWNEVRKQSVINVNPAWVRFPGGTIGNMYKWKDCIGPIENRFGMHGYTFAPDDCLYGPDEAARLAEAADAHLLILVSVNKSAQYAADWVEYMNAEVGENPNGGIDYAQVRADNGHPEPYGVTYWEIVNEGGNSKIWPRWGESYDPGDNSDGTGQYAHNDAQFRNWAANGGNKSFTGYKAVTNNSWLDSDIQLQGQAGEKRYTKLAPVVRTNVKVKVGSDYNTSATWTMVDDFSASSATDTHFTFDESKGEITFGDGTNGMIPSSGQFVFTDFSIENYDGHKQIYAAMKTVDPDIIIASGYSWMKQEYPDYVDGDQQHGGQKNTPDVYPADPFYSGLSKVLGEYTFRYKEKANPQFPFFVTEIETTSPDMSGTMFNLLFYAKAAAWGKNVPIIGPNYMLSTLAENKCHINHEQNGSIIQGPGYVTMLFNSYFGRRFVSSSVTNMPTHQVDYYKNSWDASMYSDKLEKVYPVSSLSEDGNTLYVMGINTTPTESVTANLEVLSGTKQGRVTSCMVLKAASLTARNDASSPYEISVHSLESLQMTDNQIQGYVFPPASATVFEIALEMPQAVNELGGERGITLYPNPVTNVLYLEGLTLGEANVSIFKGNGIDLTALTNFEAYGSGTLKIDLTGLPVGLYLVKVNDQVLKFVKY